MKLSQIQEATLLTSNANKLQEFQAYLGDSLKMDKGPDIKEVQADADTVCIYKSLDAGANTIIEDTILVSNGEEIVDIRYRLGELRHFDDEIPTQWDVRLAFNDGENIHLFLGSTFGVLKRILDVPEDAFGFDPNFFPTGHDTSLYDLNKAGKKRQFSARMKAISNMTNLKPYKTVKIADIAPWQGEYQE